MTRTLLLLLCWAAVGHGLFEDQVGKWDWRIQPVGCPRRVLFAQGADGKDLLLMATAKNAVASVDSNSGEIKWRQLNEVTATTPPDIELYGEDVLLVANGGEYVRVFDANTGVLKSQRRFGLHGLSIDKIAKSAHTVLLLDGNVLSAFGDSDLWKRELPAHSVWLNVIVSGKAVHVVGKDSAGTLNRKTFLIDGQEVPVKKVDDENKFNVGRCASSKRSFVCIDGAAVKGVHFNGELAQFSSLGLQNPTEITSLGGDVYSVRDGANVVFLALQEGAIKQKASAEYSPVVASASTSHQNPTFAVFYEARRSLKIIQGGSTFVLNTEAGAGDAPVDKLSFVTSEDGQVAQVVLVREDCRVDFLEGRKGVQSPSLEWSRFEALASISSVEMIDLPLSEAQATIEHEFGAVGAPLWKSFLLRLYGQSEQLKKSVVSFLARFYNTWELVKSGQRSLSDAARHLFGLEAAHTRRPKPGAFVKEASEQVSLERDYFNLRKMIVVSTLEGSVYGLHSEHGLVLWSLHLGSQFEPMVDQFGVAKVPLLIQRSTAHYQFSSQAAVVFHLKASKNSRVVLFDPINGVVLNSHTFARLKRVELLPFATEESITPLLLVDAADNIRTLPSLPASFEESLPVHLFNVDVRKGVLSGGLVNVSQTSYKKLWESRLHLGADERIVRMQGKPPHQKVHSQGKVLGDRSVLYKYSNPNLVAILTVDTTHTTLGLFLVDAVSGQVIYSARQDRATEPVHLLHCENWVTYTYWNEKSRRSEVAVVELFEGLEQTNAAHFNSFTTLRHPLNIISKSFVFPQGISAIGASDTELGLTTRNVLIAMPFGGLMEVSRRVLDARRPLDMTPELREEMVIPYIPEIPIATEDLINYNRTILGVTGIKTAPSGLESTSLMLAYGLDLFFTRLTPSGTFDILKDDFDYILISIVMVGLVVASVVCKRLARYQSLKQAWA